MRISVLGNDEIYVNSLQDVLEKIDKNIIVNIYKNYQSFIESFDSTNFDLIIIDLDMPDELGFKATIEIRKKFPHALIIFITGNTEHICKGYQYNGFRAIYKYKSKDNYLNTLIKSLKDVEKELEKESLLLTYKSFAYKINLSEILYCLSCEHYIFLYCREKEYKFRISLKDIKDKLKHAGFIEVYKGTMVKQSEVSSIDLINQLVYLNNGTKIRASKKGIKMLFKVYSNTYNEKHLHSYTNRG